MRSRCFRWCFLAASLLYPISTLAQNAPPSLDASAVSRLRVLGRVWGDVKYFHPSLAYRDVDWDGALVASVPFALAASSESEFVAAVDRMLEALEDPVTTVVPKTSYVPVPQSVDPSWSSTTDGILVLSIPDANGLTTQTGHKKMQSLGQDLGKARAVLLDLRSSVAPDPRQLGMMSIGFRFTGLNWGLCPYRVTGPGDRRRMHSGYSSPDSPGGYSSAFVTSDGETFLPLKDAAERPMTFLVNENSDLPAIALALQGAGAARIVVDSGFDEASLVATHRIALTEKREVRMRLAELMYPDATSGFDPDTVVPRAGREGGDPALEAALETLRGGSSSPRSVRPRPPASAPQRVERPYDEMAYPSLPYRVLAAFTATGTGR